MVATIPFNPYGTTNAAGTFTVATDGGVQGTFMDDPAVRFALAGGILSTSETIPMWGGVGIYRQIPTVGTTSPDPSLGTVVGRATNLTSAQTAKYLSAFSVFNQAHAMVTTTSSPVPLAASGNSVNFFPLGSGARIWVQADGELATLYGDVTGTQVSWDFNNQVLTLYNGSVTTVSIGTLAYTQSTGLYTITATTASLPGGTIPDVGDLLYISGVTNTGTGGAAIVNGSFPVYSTSGTTTATINFYLPTASGVIQATPGGSGLLTFSEGALSCNVLRVVPSGNQCVYYNSYTGYATWQYNAPAALIQI
jgi:hypothetical protein